MRSPVVYVVQEKKRKGPTGEPVPLLDLTPALEFGSLEYLLPAHVRVYNGRDILGTLRTKLNEFTDADYLLCIGDPTAMAMAVTVAALNNRGRVKLLVWDAKAKAYIPVPIDFYHRY